MKNGLSRLLRASALFALAAGLVWLSGCGEIKVPENSVSGKVVFNKNIPIPFGSVRFFNDKGMIGKSAIRRDGSYFIASVPTGEVKICVRAELPSNGNPMEKMDKARERIPEIMKNWNPESGKPPPRFRPPIVRHSDNDPKRQSEASRGPSLSPEIQQTLKKLNKKYGSPKTTTLTYVIQAGDQNHDIVLPSP